MDCMSSLQRRVDEDKAELLNRLEEMYSEDLVRQAYLFLLKIQYRRRMERKMRSIQSRIFNSSLTPTCSSCFKESWAASPLLHFFPLSSRSL